MKGAPAQIFTALFPLVLFWAIEEFWGLKAALVVGCGAAVLEVGWEFFRQKRVSFLTLLSNTLVLGLGGVSFLMDSGVAFKLQPAVMEVAMAAFMVATRFRGEPFLVRTFREVPSVPQEKRDLLMAQEWFVERIARADTRLAVFFIVHGCVLAWAAVWGSTRVWILLKGVLFYVLLVLVMAPMYKPRRANP